MLLLDINISFFILSIILLFSELTELSDSFIKLLSSSLVGHIKKLIIYKKFSYILLSLYEFKYSKNAFNSFGNKIFLLMSLILKKCLLNK